MFTLNLPVADTKISERDGRQVIFDFLRNKYVALTPEEWVRQQFTHFLVDFKNYPSALMGNEIELEASGKKRRCDSVVFNTQGKPCMIIEYKAPTVSITQKVFEQIRSYNLILHARYIVASNGMNHYCCEIDYDKSTFRFLPDIPPYDELRP